MPLILRIDVDRPFGKRDFAHRLASRIASEIYFPRMKSLDYLGDLESILQGLNRRNSRSFVFFRRCTLPSESVMRLIREGGHAIGMHLENSRSLERFKGELRLIESYVNSTVSAFSKHGSGVHKYGLTHYAPYEPEKYREWGLATNMKFFFGNLQDPTITDYFYRDKLRVFPGAFWLEEECRDTNRYDVHWLVGEAAKRDIVLLFHPDNVTASPRLMRDLEYIFLNAPIASVWEDSASRTRICQ